MSNAERLGPLSDVGFRGLFSLIFLVAGVGHFVQKEVMLARLEAAPLGHLASLFGSPEVLMPLSGVALVVGGLGISETTTRNAIEKLPPEVTLSFAPYGRNLQTWIDRARAAGHEVLLELPMEPYDYPANDPGPYTLLTSLSAADNLDRLTWLMSRFTGYVGVTSYQGAKFTADRASMEPIFEALESRGVMYVDPGASRRSTATELAANLGLPWTKGDRAIDPGRTARAIDAALANLQQQAGQNGVVVGLGTAFPVTIERIQKWTEGLAPDDIVLVPVSATARNG